MNPERYRLSFTTGGLFPREAPRVVEHFLALGDWARTREALHQENLLQVRTATAAIRIGRELIARLELMDGDELAELLVATPRDRAYLLWAAACRRYPFIHDFAVEVLREYHLLLRRQLALSDFDAFYHAKALWHPELEDLTLATQRKLRQNLLRMLREADLLSDRGQIQPALLTPRLAQLLARRGPEALFIFPATDNEIQRWLH